MGGDRKQCLGICGQGGGGVIVAMETVQVLKQVNWMPVGALPAATDEHVCVCLWMHSAVCSFTNGRVCVAY